MKTPGGGLCGLSGSGLARFLAAVAAVLICWCICAATALCQEGADTAGKDDAGALGPDPAQGGTDGSGANASSGEEATAGESSTEGTEAGGAEPTLIDPETGELDLTRLLNWLDDLYRAESSVAEITLTVTKPRRTRTLTMKAWTLGAEKALVVIEAPAREKGTATLKVGKNLWNYLPHIARTIRIPPSMMMSSWMGSDFTNDDLVRESSLLDDYEGEVAGRSTDPEGWTINLKAKEGTVGLWERIEYVVSPDGRLPLLARYYDRRGRLARTMTFTDVRDFGGRRVPARLELTPTDEAGQKTVLVYDTLEFGVELPESMFSLSQLEQHR